MLINLIWCDRNIIYYSTKWKKNLLKNPKKLFLSVYTPRQLIIIFFKKTFYLLLGDFKKARVVK